MDQWESLTNEEIRQKLARMIDHTLLRPEATPDQISRLCEEARQYHFATVFVNSSYVELCAQLLKGTDVKVGSVAGFPLGACLTEIKVAEAQEIVARGGQEVDMVIHIGRLKAGDDAYVRADIQKVVESVGPAVVVKVILETCLLTDEEKRRACRLAKEAGAHFVKTSTGFGSAGARARDIALMREVVGPEMGVKASGGIRTFEAALEMVRAGANRIGTSAGVTIVTGK